MSVRLVDANFSLTYFSTKHKLINFVNHIIQDIDECDKVNGPFGRCGGNTICTNTPGSFGCQCKPGFTGNAFKQCTGMTT